MGGPVMAEKVYLDDNGNAIAPQKTYLDDSGNPITTADTRTPQEQSKPWVSPTNPLYAPLEGMREAFHMEGNQLQGAPQAITGIPSTISNGASALWDLMHGRGDKAGDMIRGVLQPVSTSLQGAGALIAPQSIPAPSEQEFNQAAQGAGANAAGLALGEAGSRLLKRGAIPADTPVELYRTSMKRGVQVGSDISKNRIIAGNGLKYGISISEDGLTKLDGLVSDLDKAVTQRIDHGMPLIDPTVNKYSVASRLSNMAQKASNQVNPESDLMAITNSGNEFLRNQPPNIPASDALQIKKGTYRAVGDKAYGEESTAAAQSQKNLARGINEELGSLFPDIKPLLAKESELMQLRKVVEKAVNKQANAPAGRGIMTLATGGVVKTLTGSGMAGTGAAILKGVLDDPAVRSELAIALSKAQGGNRISSSAQAMFQVMKVSGALGAAQSQANSETDH